MKSMKCKECGCDADEFVECPDESKKHKSCGAVWCVGCYEKSEEWFHESEDALPVADGVIVNTDLCPKCASRPPVTDIPLLEKIYRCCWSNPEIDSGVGALPDGKHDGFIRSINKDVVYREWIEIKDGKLVLESLFNMVSKNIVGYEDGEGDAPPDPDHRFIERVWVNEKGQVEVFLGS